MPASERLVVDADAPEAAAVRRAADALRSGSLVAFPTETVYGLGGNATDPAAVAAIFEGKGRPATDPLIVHVPTVAAARHVVGGWPEEAELLARAFWPGPLTLVLERAPGIAPGVATGRPTVAVRVPAHPVAHALLVAAEVPVAAPSANRFGRISPTTADHVEDELSGVYEILLDAGPTPLGVESTVVDLSGDRPTMLRPGGVTLEDLAEVLGDIEHRERTVADEGEPLAAPGELLRHYAPSTPLVLVEGGQRILDELLEQLRGAQVSVAPLDLPGPPGEAAAALYSALRAADGSGVSLLLARPVPAGGLGRAVNDRLFRAAHGRVVLDSGASTLQRLRSLAGHR